MKKSIGEIKILSSKGEKIESISVDKQTKYFLSGSGKKIGNQKKNHKPSTFEKNSSVLLANKEGVLSYHEVQPVFNFLGYNQKEVADALDLNPSTLSRWKRNEKNETLGKLQSKFVSEIDEVIAKGVKLFGSEDNFKVWINSPNYALGDVKPIELLKNPYEIEVVNNALEAISWGNLM
ncbi:MAG: DUF2384 domain-containing protein [Bacteroidota bacterium]|nr:DUF2384 domain-containing protein [Bacteroidota bacterium]